MPIFNPESKRNCSSDYRYHPPAPHDYIAISTPITSHPLFICCCWCCCFCAVSLPSNFPPSSSTYNLPMIVMWRKLREGDPYTTRRLLIERCKRSTVLFLSQRPCLFYTSLFTSFQLHNHQWKFVKLHQLIVPIYIGQFLCELAGRLYSTLTMWK